MITDAKPRAESSLLGYAEARRRKTTVNRHQAESRVKLAWLCRGAKEEDEVKLAWAMPWRGLTEQREERLSLLRLSRVVTEGDKSQLREQREKRMSLLRLSRVMTEGDKSQNALLRML